MPLGRGGGPLYPAPPAASTHAAKASAPSKAIVAPCPFSGRAAREPRGAHRQQAIINASVIRRRVEGRRGLSAGHAVAQNMLETDATRVRRKAPVARTHAGHRSFHRMSIISEPSATRR